MQCSWFWEARLSKSVTHGTIMTEIHHSFSLIIDCFILSPPTFSWDMAKKLMHTQIFLQVLRRDYISPNEKGGGRVCSAEWLSSLCLFSGTHKESLKVHRFVGSIGSPPPFILQDSMFQIEDLIGLILAGSWATLAAGCFGCSGSCGLHVKGFQVSCSSFLVIVQLGTRLDFYSYVSNGWI